MLIDPYQKKTEQFIDATKKNTCIDHFNGPYEPNENPPEATWTDKAWQWSDGRGNTVNCYFIEDKGEKKPRLSNLDAYTLLPSPEHEILKTYALHVVGRNVSRSAKIGHLSGVRKFLSSSPNMTGDIAVFEKYIEEQGKEGRHKKNQVITSLMAFCRWLKSHELIPSNVREVKLVRERELGEETKLKRAKKIPDEKIIMALGAIQHETIPKDKQKWEVNPLSSQRDAFVCAMSTLALSSPNRAVAEQTILVNQTLKKITQMVNGTERTVHYMNWSGSKGYDDNKNHILSCLASNVEHVLKYLNSVTQCNRVIHRFYKNPKNSLKSHLAGHQVPEKKLKTVNLKVNQPTNLFILGYLLGFYDGLPEHKTNIRVKRGTPDSFAMEKGTVTLHYKSIKALRSTDEIILQKKNIARLFRVSQLSTLTKCFDCGGTSTIEDIQSHWIEHLKEKFPSFPELRNNTKSGKVDIEHALFALNPVQVEFRGSDASTPYGIISPSALGSIYSSELKGTNSIFVRNGFSKEFHIGPHQFRHYLNDCADRNGLPRAIINMWSGRKDPNQIVHYVHSSDDERADVIADIFYKDDEIGEEKTKQTIRLLSRDEYEEATGEIASITSSGICTQNLAVTPCQYLNAFNIQCLFCSKSCHIAHDEEAITLLRKDLSAQQSRLNLVLEHPRFTHSEAMQSWFKLHLTNTEKLKQLIELMTDPELEKGALVRVLIDENEFRISNLKTKRVEIKKLSLPNAQEVLEQIIAESRQVELDDITQELLELI